MRKYEINEKYEKLRKSPQTLEGAKSEESMSNY